MATRIEAQASFSNSDELDQIGGNIATGQTTVVGDEYAEELERLGLVEIVDTDVDGSKDGAEAGPDATTSDPSSDGGASGGSGSEEGASQQDTSEESSFEHTDYVDEDGTLTEEIPNHDVLAESGITTFDDLAEIAGDFQVVNGIGPMKAEDLSEAWGEIVSTE